MKSVAILGIGPSGMAAGLAAIRAGAAVVFIAKRFEASHLYGCQYLHAPIPGYEDVRSAEVDYQIIGTPEQYRKKIYGADWDGKVSPEDLAGKHQAWDIRQTYGRMWKDVFYDPFRNVSFYKAMLEGYWLKQNRGLLSSFDAVISTIPATALCIAPEHEFRSHTIYANGDTQPNVLYPPDNTIVCDGTNEHLWYRYARVFGYGTMEWPSAVGPGVPVEKPLDTDCDCWPSITRAGRYGRWEKGILVHNVYEQVSALMEKL